MTNLPATFAEANEAQALSYAVDCLARGVHDKVWGDFTAFDQLADHVLAREWCKRCIMSNPQGSSAVVDLATLHGELSAHEALVEIIDEKTDRNEPLGAVLGAYSIRLRREPFRAHSGPPRTTLLRDIIFVVLIVELVERFNLKPIRFRDHKHSRPSACSVVAEAASRVGLHRGNEEAVRKLWARMAPLVLQGFHTTAWDVLQRHVVRR